MGFVCAVWLTEGEEGEEEERPNQETRHAGQRGRQCRCTRVRIDTAADRRAQWQLGVEPSACASRSWWTNLLQPLCDAGQPTDGVADAITSSPARVPHSLPRDPGWWWQMSLVATPASSCDGVGW